MKKLPPSLEKKIQISIELIKKAESLALSYSKDGFYVAFSGGKDSQVLYELIKMSGVKFKAHMQLTSLDPPELIKFVRLNYPEVIMHRPAINFYNLIIKEKALPLRQMRYCCKYLKEFSGENTVTALGIRKSESVQRNKRNELEINHRKYSNSLDQFNIDMENKIVCVQGKDKILLSPILNWSFDDV